MVAALLVSPALPPEPPVFVLGLPAAAVVVVCARLRPRALTIAALFAAGIVLRAWLAFAGHSDVLAVTAEALTRLAHGGNPWGAGLAAAVPPGAPFAYGPVALAWYAPWPFDLRWIELAASATVLAALAIRGRPIGLAVYALSPVLALVASDGSNDTSMGLLLLVALLASRRSAPVAGVLLGLATAFKLYALAWLPGLLVYAGPPAAVSFVAASAVAWGPAFAAFGPGTVIGSIARADSIHPESSATLARTLQVLTGAVPDRGLFSTLRLVLGAAAALASLPFARSWGGFVAGGAVVFLVTLYSGYWASFAYLAALAPIVCWELDGMLGRSGVRAPLPGDPAGRLEAWTDRVLPVRDAARDRATA